MSLGYCGRIELFAEDDSTVTYRYGGENWNATGKARGDINVLDGEVLIQKCCLVEPDIRIKMKRTATRKKVEIKKRIIQRVDIFEVYKKGDIKIIKPCSSEYFTNIKPYGMQNFFASKLLDKVFMEYQKTGSLPQSCSFII